MAIIKLEQKRQKTLRESVLALLEELDEVADEPVDTIVLLGLFNDRNELPLISQYVARKGFEFLATVGLLEYAKSTMLSGELEAFDADTE